MICWKVNMTCAADGKPAQVGERTDTQGQMQTFDFTVRADDQMTWLRFDDLAQRANDKGARLRHEARSAESCSHSVMASQRRRAAQPASATMASASPHSGHKPQAHTQRA